MENVVDKGREAHRLYLQTGKLPEFPDDMIDNDFCVWGAVFEEHPDVWIYIEVARNRRQAEESFKNYTASPSPTLLELIGMVGYVSVKNYLSWSLESKNHKEMLLSAAEQVAAVWVESFEKVDLKEKFLIALKKSCANYKQFGPEVKVFDKYFEVNHG